MTGTPLSPARLWKRMTPQQKVAAARSFWSDGEGTNDQMQAALLIAERKKFRPKTVVGLDIDRKARHLASLPSLPDTIAGRLLVAYHLAEKRPLMAAFLDALSIAHEDGLIKEDDLVAPDAARVGPAVAGLGQQFPPEDVDLYLTTLLCQDPETWGALRGLTEMQG